MLHRKPDFALSAAVAASLMAVGCMSSPRAAEAADGPAASVQPSEELSQRAEDLVLMINGQKDPGLIFSPGFLAKASAERLTKFAAAVRQEHGEALAVNRIEAVAPYKGTVYIDFEKRQFPVAIQIHPEPPHFIGGMQIGE